MRKGYEVIVKENVTDKSSKCPYTLGRIRGIIEGSGAVFQKQTVKYNDPYPMRVLIIADEEQLGRIATVTNRIFPETVGISYYEKHLINRKSES